MTPEYKKLIVDFLKRPEVIEFINNNDWDKVFELLTTDPNITSSFDVYGTFTDLLIDSKVDFCNYMKVIPAYSFYGSTQLKEANLKNCSVIKSRVFRHSAVEKIYLYKVNLKEVDVGIISAVDHDVNIIWDGTYEEWKKIVNNSNCWFNYVHKVSINCIDGIFKEDSTMHK